MSSRQRDLPAIVLAGLAALMVVAFGGSSAWAEPSTHCVKATKVSKIISGKTKHVFTGGWNDKGCTSVNATHEGKFEKLASFTESEEQQLKALLKYVKVEASGVGGKPTVQFSGTNVQVVNGTGTTESANGEGNLAIGYDEDLAGHRQTGSHNLILGQEQTFTSYGGLVAGDENFVTAPFASVTGASNEASGEYSSVSGGVFNIASGRTSSISGGESNTTPTRSAWIGGGDKNETFSKGVFLEEGVAASIFGGKENKTAISYGAIPGCVLPGVSGEHC